MTKLFGRLAGVLLALALMSDCRRAEQGHHRGRRRAVPVLSADRAGAAARRVRQGRPRRRTGQFQGRLAGADRGDRRQRRCGVGLLRPLRQSRRQEPGSCTAFVVYDRYPGLVLGVSPAHTGEINSIKDLAGKKVGVSAPGSSTDFFLKYLLAKNGVDPNSAAVIGIGLDATAVAAMEQGTVDAAVMLDPAATLLQGKIRS